jgi:hypothetical protein
MDKMIDLIEKCFAVGWTIFFFGGFFVFVTQLVCVRLYLMIGGYYFWLSSFISIFLRCFLVWIAKMYFIIFHQEKYTEIKESCTLY